MPRPETTQITFTIDGREVAAPAGMMLADAAKHGDVEIPVFCYEPKLGAPVGACRMCLVEVEGIPKLQTACSTPVKDGMVVNTTAPKVKAAQESVLEFLLVNHPLDCPVCDKGGECPLQDITYGWGRGETRVVEPKRHFTKPLELSPLIAIDRERCILCYRCARFSQEISEDHQLVLLERGADSYIGTFDSHPYVAPFSGNIIELCPVGALTSRPYRFRARPWDIEGSGSVCTLCPSQCNVEYTVRDEKVLRVLSRQNDAVDDGWLCDKGRFAYQATHVDARITQPLVRGLNGELAPASWDEALDRATVLLRAAGAKTAALAGGRTTNEEGFLLQRLVRDGLESPHLDSRVSGGPSRALTLALGAPELQASVPDLEFAHAVLVLGIEPVEQAAGLDLRLRKGARRHGVQLHLATALPSRLDPRAATITRYAPAGGEALLCALAAALDGAGDVGALADAAGSTKDSVTALAAALKGAGEDRVILYGESLLAGPAADNAAAALLRIAAALDLSGPGGAGLIGIPDGSNGRGLREVGVVPFAGPGLAETSGAGLDTAGIRDAITAGELSALIALGLDPADDLPGRTDWMAGLGKVSLIASASFLTEGVVAHADVIFPEEAPAEQEGTVVHPDGRLQRVRPAIRRVGDVRGLWWALAQLGERLGTVRAPLTSSMVFAELVEEVPFWQGITLNTIGGKGERWVDQPAAVAWPAAPAEPAVEPPITAAPANGKLRLGAMPSLWHTPEVRNSPAVQFLAGQGLEVELAPADAERLGIWHGADVTIAADDQRVFASAHLRTGVPVGTAVLPEQVAFLVDDELVTVALADFADAAAGDAGTPPEEPAA